MRKSRKTASEKVVDRFPEWRLQQAICEALDARGVVYAAGLEGVRLNPYQAQLARATGMQAGEPDLRIYREGGKVVFIELKAKGGRSSPEQLARHELLRSLGFEVHLLKAITPEDAVSGALAILGLS